MPDFNSKAHRSHAHSHRHHLIHCTLRKFLTIKPEGPEHLPIICVWISPKSIVVIHLQYDSDTLDFLVYWYRFYYYYS